MAGNGSGGGSGSTGGSTGKAIYGVIVAKAWADDAFRQKLTSSPKEVLTEYGWYIPENAVVTVTQGSGPTKIDFVLPNKPAGINANDLKPVADMFGCCTSS